MPLRNDINFLRALAVTLVVLYHFEIKYFNLGFIGVDIFFVISGFLMNKIIIEKINSNTFSLKSFYIARAVRIFPALFAMCITIYILSWFFLYQKEFLMLSSHILASLNFFSNFTYWSESGYFDEASKAKILLHTWSLSLEWQFYLLYPILIFFLYKSNIHKKRLLIFSIILFILSLSLPFIVLKNYPIANFYLLPSRLWEFLAGAIIYLLPQPNRKYKKIIFSTGIFLLFFSLSIEINMLWPNYITVLTVLGVALIILSNTNYNTYQLKVFKTIGLASYSIYLWHWPIFYFCSKFETSNTTILGILTSLLFGIISYIIIEKHFTNILKKMNNRKLFIIWFFTIGITSYIAYWGKLMLLPQSPKQSKVQKILEIDYSDTFRRDECLIFPGENFRKCEYGTGQLSFLVVGDSHSNAMLLAINNALENNKVISWAIARCSPISNLKNSEDPLYKCGELLKRVQLEVSQYPNEIPLMIISALNLPYHGHSINDVNKNRPSYFISKPHSSYTTEYYNEITQNYVNKICEFSKDRKVYLMRPTPEFPYNVPSKLADHIIDRKNYELSMDLKTYWERNLYSWQAQDLALKRCKNIEILNLNHLLCDDKKCFASKDFLPLYSDNYHISKYGADLVTPFFEDFIKNLNTD